MKNWIFILASSLLLFSCSKDRPKNIAIDFSEVSAFMDDQNGLGDHLPYDAYDASNTFRNKLEDSFDNLRFNYVNSKSSADVVVYMEHIYFSESTYEESCGDGWYYLSDISMTAHYSIYNPRLDRVKYFTATKSLSDNLKESCDDDGYVTCKKTTTSLKKLLRKVTNQIKKEVRRF